MLLTAESLPGLPDWLINAYALVAKTYQNLTPSVLQITDLTMAFFAEKDSKNQELFENPSALVRQAEIRKFSVLRAGKPETPEVELHFKAYIPFSRKFWAWLGEKVGTKEGIYMAFPSNLGRTVPAANSDQEPTLGFEPGENAGDAENQLKPLEFARSNRWRSGGWEGRTGRPPVRGRPRPRAGTGKKKSGPRELAAEHAKHAQPPKFGRPRVDPLSVN